MRSAELVGVAQPIACCGEVGGIDRRSHPANRRGFSLNGSTKAMPRTGWIFKCDRKSQEHDRYGDEGSANPQSRRTRQ